MPEAEGHMPKRDRISFLTRLFALFVPLWLYMGGFGNVLYIELKQDAVPLVLNIAFSLTGILLSAVFYCLMMKRFSAVTSRKEADIQADAQSVCEAEADAEENIVVKVGESKKKKPSFAVLFLNYFFGLAVVLTVKQFMPGLSIPRNSVIFYFNLGGLVILAFLFMVFLAVSWEIARGEAQTNEYAGLLKNAVKLLFCRAYFFAKIFFLTFFAFASSLALHIILWTLLKKTSLSPLLSYFYRGVSVSCLSAFFLIFLFSIIASPPDSPVNAGQGKKKGTKAIPAFIFFIICLIAALYNIVPHKDSVNEAIKKEYGRIVENAEAARASDMLYLCGTGYKEAYALTQAVISYLLLQEAEKSKDMTDAIRSESRNKSLEMLKTAYEFCPKGGLIHYFDALRQIKTNPYNGAALLEKVAEAYPGFADSYFILLDLYKLNKKADKIKRTSNEIIKNETFVRPLSMDQLSLGTIKRLINEYEEKGRTSLENVPATALCLYENKLYEEAMEELLLLRKFLPEDLAVNYLIAVTDLEIKWDNKRYTDALEASQRIMELYPGEDWAVDFAIGVAIRANNHAEQEKLIKDAYSRHPEDFDIAEQYAYSLLQKNPGFNYTDNAAQAEKIIDGIIGRDENRWFAQYCKSIIELFKTDYESSISHFEKFCDILSENAGLHGFYDDFYNLYALKYAEILKSDIRGKSLEALNKMENADLFLYNYIQGVFCWRKAEYESGEKFMQAAVDIRPDLSKPYFILGSICFEIAGTLNRHEYYAKAEDQYRKALAIFPEDPYAWFSLGHVLRKTGRLNEAMGAFQKTLTYMPSEDHATDHFGISIHSVYQIEEIKSLIDKKGGQ